MYEEFINELWTCEEEEEGKEGVVGELEGVGRRKGVVGQEVGVEGVEVEERKAEDRHFSMVLIKSRKAS